MARTALLAAALAVALVPASAFAAGRPRYGGEAVVALPGSLGQTDPALAEGPADLLVSRQIHQPPLDRSADGKLVPVLLARIPEPEEGGRTYRLELRPGLRFHDGSPITARDLADTLTRTGDGALRSPHAALVLPIAEVRVLSATAVRVRLSVPYPRWVEALAEPGLAVTARTPGGGRAGCGPFALSTVSGTPRLVAFDGHASGRPFLDAIHPLPPGARTPADVVPEGGAGAPLLSTHLLVSRARPDARALAARLDATLDREELVRTFVPGPAVPQASLLPPALDPAPPPAPRPRAPVPLAPGPVALLYDAAVPGHRAVAERIQLRLHEAGIEARLESASGRELRERLDNRRYDLALAQVISPLDPGLALATPLVLAGERDTALLALRDPGIAAGDDAVAIRSARSRAASFRGAVPIVPLYASAIPVGPAPGTALRIPESTMPLLVPSLADAFLGPATDEPVGRSQR